MVVAVFFLINTGAMVTSTHSGLSVPDWPLSFGGFFPRMVGGVFYEHGHRLTALGIITLTAILAVWVWRSHESRLVKGLVVAAISAVLVQAVLGGLTVLFKLPVLISAAHAATAQLFFCLIVSVALCTSPGWKARPEGHQVSDRVAMASAVGLTLLVYGQIILGAVIRHEYIGLAIPDFPTSQGHWIPSFDSWAEAMNASHRLTAAGIVTLAFILGFRMLTRHGSDGWLANPAKLLMAAVCLQVVLGGLAIWSKLQPLVATSHVAGGALVLATSVVLALRTRRTA
jgi:cytochrome c oxidase assembly protein subunit 15